MPDTRESSYRPVGAHLRDRYAAGLAWFLAHQNRDGSWGARRPDRVTYTAQAVQLLRAAGFEVDDPRMRRAVRWLEDNVTPGDAHWYSRVEVGLLLGDAHRLADAGHLNAFLGDLQHDLAHPDEDD